MRTYSCMYLGRGMAWAGGVRWDRAVLAVGLLTVAAYTLGRGMAWAGGVRWDRAVLAVGLLAIAAATNPDDAHFVRFVKEYTQRGLGFLPGDARTPLGRTPLVLSAFPTKSWGAHTERRHRSSLSSGVFPPLRKMTDSALFCLQRWLATCHIMRSRSCQRLEPVDVGSRTFSALVWA